MSGKKIKKQNFKGISQKKYRVELDFLEKQNTEILGELSIVETDIKANFSFKDRINDIEYLQNPNIIEKNSSNIKNNPVNLSDKFDEIGNPLFELDDNLPENAKITKRQPRETKNIVRRVKSTGQKANKRSSYR